METRTSTTMAIDSDGSADAFATALRRAQAEFLEMPGLQLTEAQAARLWSFDSALCSAVLGGAGGVAIPRPLPQRSLLACLVLVRFESRIPNPESRSRSGSRILHHPLQSNLNPHFRHLMHPLTLARS